MCINNYNNEKGKYKHLSYAERTMIERWHNKDKKSKKEISKLLGKSERTVRREIQRGKVVIKGYMWEDKEEYSARYAQDKYEYNKTDKGPELKLDQDKRLVEHIEKEMKENKKSPEAIASELKTKGFNISVTGKTIRNAIKLGTVFDIKQSDMIYTKKHNNKNKEKRVSKMIPADKSIEYRPKEANTREEYGHWEGDLVIGGLKRGAVLFTLTERRTREEIIIKIKGKKTEYVAKAMNGLEREYRKEFYSKFKTITFDNGVEFMDYKGIESSCIRKEKRTRIYYAHPYCSGERGSNENNNRLIRRWIPKGTRIDEISKEYIKGIEEWINNYPREMFGYKSTNMILLNI
jgi:IS30 family transposase